MLRTITPAEMKRVENRAMTETEITGEQLMGRAAAHVAEAARRLLPGAGGRVVAVCGTGNNGGDGILALGLLCAGNPVLLPELWLMEGKPSPDCERELLRLQRDCPQVALVCISAENGEALPPFPTDTVCILDALFGTGLSRELTGSVASLCGKMSDASAMGLPVVAVDIPSGLNGETGEIMGAAVQATQTVTFHRPKPGLWLGQGPKLTGKILVCDIGIPPQYDNAEGLFVLEPLDLPGLFPPRRALSHKGSYGRVLVVAGSRGMAGAAAICATAALRTGAGLVTVACPESILSVVQQLCPCATCLPLPEGDGEAAWALLWPALLAADAVALGCGLGTDAYGQTIALRTAELLIQKNIPAVVDADALNALARAGNDGLRFSNRQIFTPHPAEAARLLDCPLKHILDDALASARLLQGRYGASVVLKGASSVLVSGGLEGLNVLGTPALAKGGSGDALTGALAALLANTAKGALPLSGLEVLQAGCALHGLAARAAAGQYGERGVLATDVCAYLGRDFYKSPLHESPLQRREK